MKNKNSFNKRIISVVMAVVLLFGTAASAIAAEEYISGDYTYTVNGTNAKITAYPETATGAVTIPSTLDGYSVNEIGAYSFYACTLVSSVTIPDGVTKIGANAFGFCTSLESVTIPKSVISIGSNAFDRCPKVVIVCESGSYAEQYAKEKGITVQCSVIDGVSIELSETEYRSEIKEEFTISGTIKSDEALKDVYLTWSCNDDSAIKFNVPASMINVSANEIIFSIIAKGLKDGKYKITVTSSVGAKASADIEIINLDLDTDGDGICDYWEENGIDTNEDGILELDLKSMGADPNVPDIFVEIDWMVRPAKKFLFWETKSSYSFRPNENIMRTIYNVFKTHGINIHLDVGEDSTDFVTGKKWGDLSGGNEIEYVKTLNVDRNYQTWNDLLDMSEVRTLVFHHCIFADYLYSDTSNTTSGITPGFGQYFAVTLGGWGSVNDTTIAGTFMHELGHSLGLRHGGCDHEHYKPNYLSIMNYAFQTTGLAGTGNLNYSDYKLPDINEADINEMNGIDPTGMTSGTNLATTIFYRTASQITTGVISRTSIDFNGNGVLDQNVSLDLNPGGNVYDSEISVLKSYNDWNGIDYHSGLIGSGTKTDDISTASISEGTTLVEEKTLEESLETATLATNGTGYIELVSSTVVKNVENQNIYFDIINLGSEDTIFTVSIKCNAFVEDFYKEVFVSGSQSQIEKTRISIPANAAIAEGSYKVLCEISSKNKNEVNDRYSISVYSPTEDEIQQLIELIDREGSMEEIDNDVVSEIRNVVNTTINKTELSINFPSTEVVSYGDSIILHANIESKLPEGAKIVWTADNTNFTYKASADGTTCTITPSATGDTVFTATIVDADGNEISSDTQVMTAKAGFFQKIIAFFKKLFGLTKVIPEVFKF